MPGRQGLGSGTRASARCSGSSGSPRSASKSEATSCLAHCAGPLSCHLGETAASAAAPGPPSTRLASSRLAPTCRPRPMAARHADHRPGPADPATSPGPLPGAGYRRFAWRRSCPRSRGGRGHVKRAPSGRRPPPCPRTSASRAGPQPGAGRNLDRLLVGPRAPRPGRPWARWIWPRCVEATATASAFADRRCMMIEDDSGLLGFGRPNRASARRGLGHRASKAQHPLIITDHQACDANTAPPRRHHGAQQLARSSLTSRSTFTSRPSWPNGPEGSPSASARPPTHVRASSSCPAPFQPSPARARRDRASGRRQPRLPVRPVAPGRRCTVAP